MLPGFRFVRPLGSGGFADVFLYDQDMPRRQVAVKVILADAVNPGVVRSFTAEADAMARISAHPSVLTIHQASIAADGRPYLAMEFCPDSYGARYRAAPVALADVLDVGVRMAAALETAHRAGVLHRDIKPSNILITTLGAPVLADFGIAASLSSADDPEALVAMSIPWSAPEVVTERSTGSVASEVWALGATLYTLLAGRTPFASPDRDRNTRDAMIDRITRARPPAIGRPDVPAQVEALLQRTMTRDPSARPASMQALAEELRWLQYELGIPPTPFEAGATAPALASPEFVAADAPRGPVITTVNRESRRARRAAASGVASRPSDDDGVVDAVRRGRPVTAVVVAVVAVVVVGVVAVVALAASGVL